MPRVHRYLALSDIRSECRSLAGNGLHVGIDLRETEPLFGSQWDQEARDVGRLLRSAGAKVLVRGPGPDLPINALDSYVVEQVRACHQRAVAAAMHYGATTYLLRLPGTLGLSRAERLARLDATCQMIREIAGVAKPRGLDVAIEQDLETDLATLDLLADTCRREKVGMVISPSRMLCLGGDPGAIFTTCDDVLVGVDLTDRMPHDLEPRLPGRGVLRDHPIMPQLLHHKGIRFHTLAVPAHCTAEDIVNVLNDCAKVYPEASQCPTLDVVESEEVRSL